VCIAHHYTMLTTLQYRNLYVDAVTRMFIAISTKQSTDKLNPVYFPISFCHIDYDSEMFSPTQTSNQNFVCIYCFQCHAHPKNIWRTVKDTELHSIKNSLSCSFQILYPRLQGQPSGDVTLCNVMWRYRRLPASTRSKLPMSPFRLSTRCRTPQLGGYFVRPTF